MFFHQYKYRVKYFLKTPTVLFWALIFPILLGTLFQASFGKANELELFEQLPVAVVIEEDSPANQQFLTMMEQINYEEDQKMFEVKKVSRSEADSLLEKDDVYGIIVLSQTRNLVVSSSGMYQSIIQQFLNQYLHSESYIMDIVQNHPDQRLQAVNNISESLDLVQASSLKGGNADSTLQYFYALFAMACLFGCYLGTANSKDIQANLSAVGARRCVGASKKMTLVFADTSAALTIHFIELVLTYFYIRGIGVHIGDRPVYFFLTCFVGSLIGILLGQFVGVAFKVSENAKDGICTSVSLFLSFLSGLMISAMKDIVEKSAPIINRINPAALITDCFYSLAMFDDDKRFFQSFISLVVISVLLFVATIIVLRREKYESL